MVRKLLVILFLVLSVYGCAGNKVEAPAAEETEEKKITKILLTAFEPFGGDDINPAKEAARLVKDEIGGVQIVKCYVPVVFGKSIDVVCDAIDDEMPDVVLMLGQAGGRGGVTPERVAINVDDTDSPDNEGKQPVDQKIREDGENAYFSTLPIKKMVGYMREKGIPAAVSDTAGTYVCNHLMYGVLYHIDKNHLDIPAGFVHVPFLDVQIEKYPGYPSLTMDEMVTAVEACLQAIIDSYGN